MKTIIDASTDFSGHVILWAKGWYGGRSKGGHPSYERLDEVLREWSGLSDDYTSGPKRMLTMVAEVAEELRVRWPGVMDEVTRQCSLHDKSSFKTSYHVGWNDQITQVDILNAISSSIGICKTNSENFVVRLPRILPGLKKKYDLEDLPEEWRRDQA